MSKIEWTEKTWNPIVGCERISLGCQNCYAERMARRLEAMGQEKYHGVIDKNGRWTGNLHFDIDNYDAPLRRKQPTVYFVNSMSDLFHESVGFNWLMRVWNVMRDTPQHTYQILTKRADIMERIGRALAEIYGVLPNVWLGVSVENQEYADKRIPHLLKIPAARRFLSCEPLLGQINFDTLPCPNGCAGKMQDGKPFYCNVDGCECERPGRSDFYLRGIDWVIVGGESGPKARPMHPDWARSLRDQCQNAEVPFFFKQWGEFVPASQWDRGGPDEDKFYGWPDRSISLRVGKKAAGRLLDGREWNEGPR